VIVGEGSCCRSCVYVVILLQFLHKMPSNMIYRLNSEVNNNLQDVCSIAHKELDEFFGINWVRNLPRLIIVNDRKTIDGLFGKKTEAWTIGWSENNNIYVLDKNKFSEESDHKEYTDDEYAVLVKHEMSHSFSKILAKGEVKPKWLWEGIAVYTSGENKARIRPTEFKQFLDFFDEGGKGVYVEAGFAIQLLVEKFGKQKILDLIKISSTFTTRDDFNLAFNSSFDFEPTYEEFNRLLY